jgi:hypothetical protein
MTLIGECERYCANVDEPGLPKLCNFFFTEDRPAVRFAGERELKAVKALFAIDGPAGNCWHDGARFALAGPLINVVPGKKFEAPAIAL